MMEAVKNGQEVDLSAMPGAPAETVLPSSAQAQPSAKATQNIDFSSKGMTCACVCLLLRVE